MELTAWDLAGDEAAWDDAAGFRVGKGRVVWESAQASGSYRSVRIDRLVPQDDGRILQVTRYVSPDQPVVLVPSRLRPPPPSL